LVKLYKRIHIKEFIHFVEVTEKRQAVICTDLLFHERGYDLLVMKFGW